MSEELSQQEVFSDDKDPMEAIMELRREEEKSAAPAEEVITDEEIQEDTIEEQEESAVIENGDEAENENEGEGSAEGEEDEIETAAKAEETPKVRKFKADGKEYEFTEQEMLDQFESMFGKAVNFTQKTQKLAPYRKMISALEEEGISSEQLNIAIDALKGDKGALAKLADINKIDPFDLADEETKNSYTPNEYGKNEQALNIEEITSTISKDPEFPITIDVIDKQWDQQSRQKFAENPHMIQGLHNDIRSGLYDKVAPLAMKMMVLDGNAKSNLEYYMLAGNSLQQQNQQKPQTAAKLDTTAQDAEAEFDQASSEAARKRAASSTRARADRKGVINYLDDGDEAFDEWYEKNISSQ